MAPIQPHLKNTNSLRWRYVSASFTLIEIIIAITLFAILATAGVTMVSNVSNTARKVEMEEYLYTEAQNLIERLTREIQNSGIDYEEYYSRNIYQTGTIPAFRTFGENYGEYHKQFFNPGSDGPNNGYGAYCAGTTTSYPSDTACSPDTGTFDYETGMNPYDGSGKPPTTANAFCDSSVLCSHDTDYYQTDELFLINKSGTERTYFVIENGKVQAIAMVQLDGTDTDGNGIMDTWTCANGYTCNGTNNLPSPGDLIKADGLDTQDFTPISPEALYIDELTFYITPLEDPFKAYAESTTNTFENVQLQPRVTIVLKAHYQAFNSDGTPILDFSDVGKFLGNVPSITLQTTVGTGVTNVIPAYTSP